MPCALVAIILSCPSVWVVCKILLYCQLPLWICKIFSILCVFLLFYIFTMHIICCICRDCYLCLFSALCSAAFHFHVMFVRLSHSIINITCTLYFVDTCSIRYAWNRRIWLLTFKFFPGRSRPTHSPAQPLAVSPRRPVLGLRLPKASPKSKDATTPWYAHKHTVNITRKPCCRKETARCRRCPFRFKVRRQHSLQV